MQLPAVAAVQVIKVASSGLDDSNYTSSDTEDLLAVEQPLEISIIYGEEDRRQQKNISVTMCTPGHDDELAVGFLFTEGIISEKKEVKQCFCPGNNTVIVELQPGVSFDTKKIDRHFYTSSSCGVCGKSSIDAVKNTLQYQPEANPIIVSPIVITTLPESLKNVQEVFKHTGGLHASALFDLQGKLILTREDVGRHNALDKLIGAFLLAGEMPLTEYILLLSGRASFELIQKAAMAGIRIVCAVGAPSSLAVELAKESGITLIGFLRSGRFNIYCGGHRITTNNQKSLPVVSGS